MNHMFEKGRPPDETALFLYQEYTLHLLNPKKVKNDENKSKKIQYSLKESSHHTILQERPKIVKFHSDPHQDLITSLTKHV